MKDDIVPRLPQTGLIPSRESDLQVVHGLAAELRFIAHDHARDDGFVKFSGTRWLSYYHSLDRILIEHDRRQAEIYKYADEIERMRQLSGESGTLRLDRDEARREICLLREEVAFLRQTIARYQEVSVEWIRATQNRARMFEGSIE